jgi:hypothetical protein
VVTGVVSKEGTTPATATRVVLLQRVTKLLPRDLQLYAWYKFDSTSGTSAVDSGGYGLNGTLNSAAWAAGHSGNAVSLNGTSSYVSLPAAIMGGADNFTVAAWVYLNANNGWNRIFDFGTGTSVNMFLTPSAGGGVIRFAITTGGGGGEQQVNGTSALPTGSWQHVAVTLSGNLASLYVNGVKVGQNTNMTLRPSSLGNTSLNYMGKSQYGDPYFSGLVDDFRIYRESLTAAEIGQLYAGTLN